MRLSPLPHLIPPWPEHFPFCGPLPQHELDHGLPPVCLCRHISPLQGGSSRVNRRRRRSSPPFISSLDQPHLLRDLVAFRCHRRQWHHGPGGSRFFASADDTGLQLLGRLSCQPPVSPASWAHHLPLHSHGKNDDHLSDGDRGKGLQGTQDDNVCVSHQPRQIPIFSFLVSFLSSLLSFSFFPSSSSIFSLLLSFYQGREMGIVWCQLGPASGSV